MAAFLLMARILPGLGRLLPCEPRRILPFLERKSPLPMIYGVVVNRCME